jgi:hypothetical protein
MKNWRMEEKQRKAAINLNLGIKHKVFFNCFKSSISFLTSLSENEKCFKRNIKLIIINFYSKNQ